MTDIRKIMLAGAYGRIIATLPHHPVRIEYLDKPTPPQPEGKTTKRAKVKAARKQRTKP